MTDRRDIWSKADDDEISELCDRYGLKRADGKIGRVSSPVADLFATPEGPRDRQMLRGQGFKVHALSENGWTFGETVAGAYSGWIEASQLDTHPDANPTHRIKTAQSYGKTTGGLKAPGKVTPLSMGSELIVLNESDGWSQIAWANSSSAADLFVPSVHLTGIADLEPDPVAVAERLLGTPYLWGGNSAFGIDCSGLVQIACHASRIPCPGDSDQQMAQLGVTLEAETAPKRGDLLFWKGHVGWVSDPETLLHANAFHMAVTYEPLAEAICRIDAQGDGPVLRHARLSQT